MHTSSSTRVYTGGKYFFDREGKKLFLKGITYGPFQPGASGEPFPALETLRRDLLMVRELGANLLRIYHPPSHALLEECRALNLYLLISIPWTQHVDFFNDPSLCRQIAAQIAASIEQNKGNPTILGYLIGNEIRAELVRWQGPSRVQRFLEELIELGRSIDPMALFSYAKYPSTEYLLPRNSDFFCFNIYLHQQQKLEAYLHRAQNLSGNKPLLLGEFGLDTIRHSEEEQAQLILRGVESSIGGGLAGTVIFAWTDEWFTGGELIQDWAFGLVDQKRNPKLAYHALQACWKQDFIPICLLPLRRTPKVSVIVCAYNAAATLGGCLESLEHLNYPDYEVIVIDDGSTDDTSRIAARFSGVIAVRQPVNLGLSHARNCGAQLAGGEVLAYIDADCQADADWLYYLVKTLSEREVAAVGGPNIPPKSENWLRACIAAAPGGPSHVLLNDWEAEHIPGCNMALWRSAYEAVDGFDPQFHTAGDDVDLCWRLRQKEMRIAFSPSAMVWHYRRFTTLAFVKQQLGYGEAESLLRVKHLGFFGAMGQICWRGTIYDPLQGIAQSFAPVVYHGLFGQGLFQTVYNTPRYSALSAIIGSFEWFCLSVLCLAFASWMGIALWVPAGMLAAPLCLGSFYLSRGKLETRYDHLLNRLVLTALAVIQPVARGYGRFLAWQKLKRQKPSAKTLRKAGILPAASPSSLHSLFGNQPMCFWSEEGNGREALLHSLLSHMGKLGWNHTLDTGWERWDLQIYGSSWWVVQLSSTTEYHGGPKCLTRIRLKPQATTAQWGAHLAAIALLLASFKASWPVLLAVAFYCLLLQAGNLLSAFQLCRHVQALTLHAAGTCKLYPLDKKQKGTSKNAVDAK